MNYNLVLKTPFGNTIGLITEFISLEYARGLNSVGKATIRLPSGLNSNLFERDQRIEIWRNGKMEMQTFWLIRKISRILIDGSYVTELTCHDTMDILDRRIVNYQKETYYADKLIINGNDDYEDNLIKAFVRENLGSLSVATARNISTLTIEPDTSDGSTSYSEKQASYRSLLSTCVELAQLSYERGAPIYFDIESDEQHNLTFKTYADQRGKDLVNGPSPVVLSDQFGVLADVNITKDYSSEITSVTVGGSGPGAGRAIETVTDATRVDASPFNRIEGFYDARDWEDPTLLIGEGNNFLAQNRPKSVLTAKVIDSPQVRYDVHYSYGDMVVAIADGMQFTCLIDAVGIKVSDGREELDVRLKGEVLL